MILIEKRQIINQTKILEFENSKISFKDIGGLENLKKWLQIRKSGFTTKAKLYGLPAPRGLLLTGIQGTGKSLTAKAIATEWNLPLLKLDIGKLFGGILGESENRIRQMIEVSEALAPCIIWIDEIDKAFNVQSKNSDSGTSDGVLGTFINWLSEKKSKVFVIATANNFSTLPLEIIRKGRFDEIFFIGLPNLNERKNILLVFLKRLRPKNYEIFDIETLGQKSEGFSGAELEQSIVEAMHIAFHEKREFTNEDILLGLKEIIPISQIDTKRIKQIEELALSGKIRLASKNEKSSFN
jgi:SpoVK/Ycf46/Vps4 family AAA+-type ATPase